MKFIIFICLFFSFSFVESDDSSPVVIGKLVKLKHEKEGTNYFITFKKENRDYAYPIDPESRVRNLDQFTGKTLKVYGVTRFKKSIAYESKHIMFFKVKSVQELSLKDLAYKNDNLNTPETFLNARGDQPSDQNKSGFKISDKAANTAILLGGSALAAEVLSQLLK